jgi:hypothetical protein
MISCTPIQRGQWPPWKISLKGQWPTIIFLPSPRGQWPPVDHSAGSPTAYLSSKRGHWPICLLLGVSDRWGQWPPAAGSVTSGRGVSDLKPRGQWPPAAGSLTSEAGEQPHLELESEGEYTEDMLEAGITFNSNDNWKQFSMANYRLFPDSLVLMWGNIKSQRFTLRLSRIVENTVCF